MPELVLLPRGEPLKNCAITQGYEYAESSGYVVDGGALVFVFYPDRYPQLDPGHPSIYVAGSFNGWAKAIGSKAWHMSTRRDHRGREIRYLKVRRRFEKWKKPALFKFVTGEGHWLDPVHDAPNVHVEGSIRNYCLNLGRTGRHRIRFSVDEEHPLALVESIGWADDPEREFVEIRPGSFFYRLGSDRPLGASVEAGRTTFRLFAPRAYDVKVVYYDDLIHPRRRFVDMTRGDDDVWEVVIDEDLTGQYYRYRVAGTNDHGNRHFDPDFPILDPYALATVHRDGPGIVLDRSRLPRPRVPFQPPAWHDLVICEAHVRDLIARAPIDLDNSQRLGFSGLREWVRHHYSYFRRMGFNAVELQPVQEFDNAEREEYHWGYMPVNYFSPESSYGTDSASGLQVEEFAALVETFHDEGMAVILDVVYNHTGEPNHLLYIDKAYYFELSADDHLMNWSGTGNDLRCYARMVRRMIIDSLRHLVETYDVDGFRFDLAELIGVDVLREVEAELKRIKPGIILIAEPWSFRGHIAWALRGTGFAYWNDAFREFLPKYVTGTQAGADLRWFLQGSLGAEGTRFPAQSVNYVESHDDHTFLDRITECSGHDGSNPTVRDRRRIHLMAGLLMSSLGVPMLSAGQDMLRSKHGVANTYQRGDLNVIDYSRAARFNDTHNYVRAWIRFRLSEEGRVFRLEHPPEEAYFRWFMADRSGGLGMLSNANGFLEGCRRVFVAFNPEDSATAVDLCDFSLEGFHLLADGWNFNPEGLPYSEIRYRENRLELPALSLCLWVERG